MNGPKILTLDIETAPAHVLVFGQYKQNISNIQVIQPDRVIGIGAKWHHEDKVMWKSEYHDSKAEMVQWIRDLLDEADIVVHFNGTTFDMPWIRREIALAGLAIPSPVREVDLLKVVRRQFRFMSNKLENVVRMFGLSPKMDTGGFELWRDIEVGTIAEKAAAWTVMREYCMNDTVIEEELYDFLIGWIPGHPHVGLYREESEDLEDVCQNCGSTDLVREGYYYTPLGKYPRFHCRRCGKWGKSKRSIRFETVRGVE